MPALTTLAIIGTALAVAGTAASAEESHVSQIHAGQAARDQEGAIATGQQEMKNQQAAKDQQNQAEMEAVAARQRQRAMASAASGGTYGGTLKTSSMGVSNPLQLASKSLLGL